MTERTLTQTAPYPVILEDIVATFKYKPGWTFELADRQRDDDHGLGEAGGLTLTIVSCTHRSYRDYEMERDPRFGYDRPKDPPNYFVSHYRIVPAATYNRESWLRWLLEQLMQIETHEACEFFDANGEHPFAPVHAPGHDPYYVREMTTDEARRTSFRGVLNPK